MTISLSLMAKKTSLSLLFSWHSVCTSWLSPNKPSCSINNTLFFTLKPRKDSLGTIIFAFSLHAFVSISIFVNAFYRFLNDHLKRRKSIITFRTMNIEASHFEELGYSWDSNVGWWCLSDLILMITLLVCDGWDLSISELWMIWVWWWLDYHELWPRYVCMMEYVPRVGLGLN